MREDEKKKQPAVDQVGQAQLQLRSQMAQPGGYKSQWQTQLDDTMNRIMNREKFSYDLNGDALWKQYKDQYTTGGKMAMMDTMGQAAALTGGYGNSYAQVVGQQAYQGYLQGLTDKIPELYQLAMDQYDREGNAMLQQYGLLQDAEAMDYGRFQDNMALVQPQVLEMLERGIRPSDEMIAASGLSKEYIDALYPEKKPGSGTYKKPLTAEEIYEAAKEYNALEPAIAEIRAAKESGLMSQDDFEYYMTKAHQELPSAYAQGIGPGETIRVGKKK